MASSALLKLACALFVCMLAAAPYTEAAVTCGMVSKILARCTTYLKHTGSPAPSTTCCAGIKTLKGLASTPADRRTACGCLNSAAASIIGIDYKKAAQLPSKCGVPVSFIISPNTDCSKYYLKDAILAGGIAFNRAHNLPLCEYPRIDDRFNKLFNDGISGYSVIMMKKMLENYKGFEGVSTLVDIARNIGINLNLIISKYPTIKGINFDLPHVIKDAPTYKGVEHIGGDMFVSVPQGDAMFIKWICCDWSDEHWLKVLKNCYAALPDHGKVIICDFILPKTSETSYAVRVLLNLDAIMFSSLVGGKIRTEEEFEALAKGAGFEGFKMACSTSDAYVVMEFLKKR